MTNKEADEIIRTYKPYRGFFDLSIKPQSLDKMEYAKILNIQKFLAEQNENREYLKKFNNHQWEKTKEMSADLQKIIFLHWGESIFS